jgi:serine/threonine protein kinase
MSPELFLGLEYVPASADIFATGYILFALYCGCKPFDYAHKSDLYYSSIWNGNTEDFWTD